MTDTTDDLKALRAAADAATPGPWKDHGSNGLVHYIMTHGNKIVADACFGDQELESHANAAFIALVNPAAIKRLLDRLEAAERDAARKDAALLDAERVLSDFYANAKVRGCESAYKRFHDAALKCREAIDATRAAHQQEGV